ncbi:shikimate dehydrogenase [Massilia sp. CCM 8733]|uniref:Shikimate dehydrogenase (NADP(+)) n=1 Tax=Massilia mucilaginosa TaxID=2609282 RepID=A0ABX0NPJ3_9BURK|nr:shikimate dehydrogenase [Massilia mucilaginosa]NHZ88779.1 shikimate dehydrogenase [Massilia mucilaginosa]
MSERYCVIGNPIAHSKSPEIHAAFARQTGQEMVYERCLAPLDAFEATVRALVAAGYKGANVTVPFKLQAADLVDRLTERARAAGAVNTLVFNSSGGIIGDNTDGAGLVGDITRNAAIDLEGKRVLLLGAGGAARGAVVPLLAALPAELTIANRTLATADTLVERFASQLAQDQRLAACAFEDIAGPYDVVINATSASLLDAMPPVPAGAFGRGTLALDMMYGKAPTRFMLFAAAQGAQARDGLGMLVEQAAEAFLLWRGARPETAALLDRLRLAI